MGPPSGGSLYYEGPTFCKIILVLKGITTYILSLPSPMVLRTLVITRGDKVNGDALE